MLPIAPTTASESTLPVPLSIEQDSHATAECSAIRVTRCIKYFATFQLELQHSAMLRLVWVPMHSNKILPIFALHLLTHRSHGANVVPIAIDTRNEGNGNDENSGPDGSGGVAGVAG